ncbi:hypothetical protein LCGC14_2163850, partial [marine sediment metagenome]
MKPGPIVLLTALAMLTAFTGASAPPKNYTAELRKATQSIQRKQWPQALKMLDGLLKKHKEPELVKELTLHRIRCLAGAADHPAAVAEAVKLQGLFPQDKDVQSKAMLLQGDSLRGQKKFPEAIVVYRKLAKDHAAYADRAADALGRAGDVYCSDLKKYPEGLAVYAEVAKTFAANTSRAADAVLRAAGVNQTLVKDMPKAAAGYLALCEKYADVYDERNKSIFYTKAVDCLRAAKKLPEAQAVAAKAEKALPSMSYKSPQAIRQVDLLMEMKKYPQARAQVDRIICAYPLAATTCQPAQLRAVGAWRAESKFAEAAGAARILYNAAGDEKSIREAAHAVAMAFRSVDGNLGRANEFLSYQ